MFKSSVFGVFVIYVCLPPATTFIVIIFRAISFQRLVVDMPLFKHLTVFILLKGVDYAIPLKS
jgi:hypothetical protein